MDKDAPILDAETQAKLCERCGQCCIAKYVGDKIGGTKETHAWLAKRTHLGYAECRFLLPDSLPRPESNTTEPQRRCAIHSTAVVVGGFTDSGIGIDTRRLRPQFCRDGPTRGNLDCLPDCPVTRAAKEELCQ